MKKNKRAHSANPESRNRRALRLSHETVRVLSSTDLTRAIGGDGCNSTSNPTDFCTRPQSGVTTVSVK